MAWREGTVVKAEAGVFYKDRGAWGTVIGNRQPLGDVPITGVQVAGEQFPLWVPSESLEEVT